MQQRGLSQRAACHYLGLNRASVRYVPRPNHNAALLATLTAYAHKRTRLGYRRAHEAMQRSGANARLNRAHRLWQRAPLQVKRRTGRKRKPPGDPTADILYPQRPGEVWSLDFVLREKLFEVIAPLNETVFPMNGNAARKLSVYICTRPIKVFFRIPERCSEGDPDAFLTRDCAPATRH